MECSIRPSNQGNWRNLVSRDRICLDQEIQETFRHLNKAVNKTSHFPKNINSFASQFSACAILKLMASRSFYEMRRAILASKLNALEDIALRE
jgi:hypothetical protein